MRSIRTLLLWVLCSVTLVATFSAVWVSRQVGTTEMLRPGTVVDSRPLATQEMPQREPGECGPVTQTTVKYNVFGGFRHDVSPALWWR